MPREHPSLYADDSDTDNEVSTPKPRPGTRKRPSLINGDASSSEPRAHLRSVNINDDAAEKRRRRKSTKLVTMDSFAGPSTDPDGEEGADTSRVVKRGPPLTTVVQAPIIDVPIDITSSKYEEWMKLTTDNVCYLLMFVSCPLTFGSRKSMPETHGASPSLIISTTCHSCATMASKLSTSSVHHAP